MPVEKSAEMNADWEQVQRCYRRRHARASIDKGLALYRALWRRFNASRYFNPLSVRTDLDGFTDPPDDLI